MTERAQFSHKTIPAPLPGSVQVMWARCSKPGCRCATGVRHGPYYRRFWREGRRTRSAYVRLADASEAAARCARHRELHMSARALRRMLADYARRAEELADVLEALLAIAAAAGHTLAEVEARRLAKRAERGGFDEGVLLLGVADPSD